MEYTIIRNNSTFTITKIGQSDIYVTVYTQSSCSSNEWNILIAEQSVSTTLDIVIPKRDNVYKIFITDKDLIEDNYIVTVYTEFLKSFIEDVEISLCGCPCKDCDDCDENNQQYYLSALTKMLSYNILNNQIYNEGLSSANDCIKCTVLDTNQCELNKEFILGNFDNTLLFKKILVYYYLVYYYTDLNIAFGLEKDKVKELYKFDKIIQCIKKLNIDVNCIKDAVESLYQIYDDTFNNTFM